MEKTTIMGFVFVGLLSIALSVGQSGTTTNISNNTIINSISNITTITNSTTLINESLWNQSGSNIFYNDGNVGIGTTSPQTELHINGSTAESITLKLDNWEANGDSSIEFSETNGVNGMELYYNGSSNELQFNDHLGSNIMVVQRDGHVGIGTNNPTLGTLQIDDSVNPQLVLRDPSNSAWRFNVIGGDLKIDPIATANRNVIFENSGSGHIFVGIGTDTPQAPLDVNGRILGDILYWLAASTTAGGNSACYSASGTYSGYNFVRQCSSSERYKEDIRDYSNPALNFIMQLNPRIYKAKDGGATEIGLIAEEVFNVTQQFDTANFNLTDALIIYNRNITTNESYIQSIDYRQALNTINLKATQELATQGQDFKQGMKACIADSTTLQDIKDCVALL